MNQKIPALTLAAALGFLIFADSVFAQGTAFTYQGRLQSGTNLASGAYDMTFTLFATDTGGGAIAGPVTNSAVGVSNGLFTTTVDFGAVFTGASNWVGIGVRSNGVGTFLPLAPRQPLTPVPYAVFANTASNVSGSISGSQILGQVPSSALGGTYSNPVNLSSSGNAFSGDGSGLTGVAKLAGGNAFTGNQIVTSGSVGIGTATPGAALEVNGTTLVDGELKVVGSFGALSFLNRNNQAETWQWNADNNGVSLQNFGGSAGIPWHLAENGQVGIGTTTPANELDVQGSADFNGSVGIGTSTPKHKLDVNGNIWLGSQFNGQVFTELPDTLYLGASRKYLGNTLGAPVDGTTDWINLMAHPLSAGIMFGLAGPSDADPHSAPVPLMVIKSNGNVGIGATNPATALQVNGTVTANSFSGDGSGLTGLSATNLSGGKVADTLLSTNVALRSGGNAFSGNQSISGNVGVGTTSPVFKVDILHSGGVGLHVAAPSGNSSVVEVDAANASAAVLLGINGAPKWGIGYDTSLNNSFDIVDVGAGNLVRLLVQNGTGNVGIGTTTPSSALQVNGTVTATGLQVNGTATATTFAGSGSALDFKVNGLRGLRLEYANNVDFYSVNVIGGYGGNILGNNAIGATIAGGGYLFDDGSGSPNSVPNRVLADFGSIGGGKDNSVSGIAATVGGGFANSASGEYGTVGGGGNNIAGFLATVSGGNGNNASGEGAMVPGGEFNTASGTASFAAGLNASANHKGAFVWADSTGGAFASTASNQFLIRATGGVGIGTNNPSAPLYVVGNPTGSTPTTEGVIVGVQNGSNINGAAVVGLSLVPGGNGIIGEADIAGGGGTPIGVIANSSAAGGIALKANATGLNGLAGSFNGACTFSSTVGIGTATPTHGTLEIGGNSGSLSYPAGSAIGRAIEAGKVWGNLLANSTPTAIYANGWVASSAGFIAVSDQRIKHILGRSDSAQDLSLLRNIEVTDYTYIDTVAKGNRPNKKVIAQQVENVFPQAVNQSTNEVPDIYKLATVKEGWVQLASDLKVGERVKLIGDHEQGIYPVLEVRDGAFRTGFKPASDKVFVYGREVNDFRSVDYDAIAMLNVSATQELARNAEAQKAALAKQQDALARLQDKLEQTVAEKEALLKRLAALEARDREREDRLARIESSLEKDSTPATYASLHQP